MSKIINFKDHKDVLLIPLDKTGLSNKALNCIKKRLPVCKSLVGDLVQITEEELLEINALGKGTLDEIKRYLLSKGLELGVKIRQPRGSRQRWPGTEIYEEYSKNCQEIYLGATQRSRWSK
jgi:DNA-directed RNA polymerase alpha subunit